ncbi:MAG: hypothetical protein K0U82_19760 [Planctomycetes bacterium]|nr:hypothetical protein [Planctomycetota bacterium]
MADIPDGMCCFVFDYDLAYSERKTVAGGFNIFDNIDRSIVSFAPSHSEAFGNR